MRKSALIITLLGIALFSVYFVQKIYKKNESQVQKEPIQKETTFDEALESISEEDIKKNLEYLASDQLEGRMSGKNGNVLAAKFIKDKFEEFELETVYQKFNIKRMNPGPKNEIGEDFTQNICSWVDGNDEKLKNEIIVVGAHMDHIGYGPQMSRFGGNKIHPGADDNASGTVALLEVAKAFSKLKNKVGRTVVFVAFSAEEMGLIGSKFYCNDPIFPQDAPDINKHVFMLNMDMVGYLGKGENPVSFSDGDSSFDIKRTIDNLSNKYSFAKGITSRSTGGSDHACFYNKRIPIAFLHTGLHPHYHKPSDTADKINFEGLSKVAKYAFELSWNIANANIRPTFNNEVFKELDLRHDHGHQEFPESNERK